VQHKLPTNTKAPPFPKLHVETRCRYGKSNQRLVDPKVCRRTQRQIKHTADLSVTGHVHAVSTPPLACFFCHSPITAALSSPHGWKIKTWSLDGRAPVALVDIVTKPYHLPTGAWVQISYFSLRSNEEKENPVNNVFALSVFPM